MCPRAARCCTAGETRAGKGGDVTLRAGAPEVEGAKGALALAGQLRGYGMPAAAR